MPRPSLVWPRSLGKGALTVEEVARATQTRPDRMHRLLRALAAFDVVKDLGSERFELTPVGECLRAHSPTSVRSLVLLLGSESYYTALASLDACVKTGQNAYQLRYELESSFAYYEKHAEAGRIFDDAMSANSALVGATAAKAYDFSGVGRIVDVGGGQGKVLASILKAHSSLRGVLFDLPRVVEGASSFLAKEGVADRCEAVGGDMFDSVPGGADAYVLSHVIHDWDDVHSTRVLQSCRRAMAPSAKLLILDRVMPERIEPEPDGARQCPPRPQDDGGNGRRPGADGRRVQIAPQCRKSAIGTDHPDAHAGGEHASY